jgi:hypothetical protein
VIVCFVDISGIVEVRGDCLFLLILVNKTNNHLSPQQFHQYQQNKQSPLTSTIPSISTKQTITSHLNNSTEVRGYCLFLLILVELLRWEVIVCFVDIGGIVEVRGDCSFY